MTSSSVYGSDQSGGRRALVPVDDHRPLIGPRPAAVFVTQLIASRDHLDIYRTAGRAPCDVAIAAYSTTARRG